MGFVYIFDYIHLKEGPTRLKHFFYYSVLTMEAAILMALWYIETNKKVHKFSWIFSKKKKIFNHFLQFLLKIESGFRPGRLCDMGKRKMVPMDRYYRNTRMFPFRHGIHDYLLPILPSGR